MEKRLPALPCPECRHRGLKWNTRIGSHRALCSTCNAWCRRIDRLMLKSFARRLPDLYEELRLRCELDAYPAALDAAAEAGWASGGGAEDRLGAYYESTNR